MVEGWTSGEEAILAAFDGEQMMADLEALGEIGWVAGTGLQRMAYSPADLAGRRWVLAQMQALGMEAGIDAAGNVVGVLPGSEPLPALALGSHTDSVPGGGKYDGALGVVGALACVRTLRELAVVLRHPLLVIDFAAEEATTAASPLGSLAFVGALTVADLEGPAWKGESTRALLAESGFDAAAVAASRLPQPVGAFVELHIEQGEQLTGAGGGVGLVTGIVGIRRYFVRFVGQANHAGTTSMARRRDALVMAAPFITAVREIAVAQGIVGTVGRVDVQPGAPNVVPGCVLLDVEIRGLDELLLDAAEEALRLAAEAQGGAFTSGHCKAPVPADPALLAVVERVCRRLGVRHQPMASGAGHDAMNMARVCPYAMIFVPSEAGISHAPAEYTAPAECMDGVRVLLATLLELDRRI